MITPVAQENSISDALKQLLLHMQVANRVKLENFLRVVGVKLPQFGNGGQQDAHEFLMALLDVLWLDTGVEEFTTNENLHLENEIAQTCSLETLVKNNAKWYEDFLIIEQYSTTCCQCHSASTRLQ